VNKIRPSRLADIPAMQWVERDAGELFRGLGLLDLDASADASVSDHMLSIEEGLSFVAEVDGRVSGFVMGEMKEGGAYLHELDVAREAQRRGFGRQLIGRFNQEARYKGAECVFLFTFRDPPWNAPFYRKLGFIDMANDDRLPWMSAMEAEQAKFLDLNTRVFMRLKLD
jgi:predicted N-acetyltransferase YhbS